MLKIREIFPSIQGEGPYSGHPAVFVRLAGCNLHCSFCDEHHAEPFTEMTDEEVEACVIQVANESKVPVKLVVVTGGEPFLQNFGLLVKKLMMNRSFQIQVETNGTIYQPQFPYAMTTLVCSPKPGSEVHPEYRTLVGAWKFLVKEGDEAPGQDVPHHRIFIQPLDEQDFDKNQRNMLWAAQMCMENGYRLSLQLHKIVGVP